MALSISTPFKTNTLSSVSGTTFTSNGTPFASTDVGRFLVFTDGPAIGQIRRITAFTSTTQVSVDLAWNVSNIAEFTDSLPVAGNTWQMSLGFADIADGTHIIQDSAQSYRQVIAAGLVTLGVFLADVEKNLVLSPNAISLTTPSGVTGGRIQLGYLHPNGYGMRGCSLIDVDTSGNGFSTSGAAGDVHLYGCNIIHLGSGSFWRLFRGSAQIVRWVDCDFSGGYSGRIQGTRSAVIRTTFTRIGTGIGVAIISPFGLFRDCKMQDSTASAFYSNFALGVATINSPRFDSVNTIARALVTGSTLTFPLEDYLESQVTAATFAVNFEATNAIAFVSFRQWVITSIVNLSLAAITDLARRVIRNGAATVVSNTTTTSGAFAKYTAEVKSFPGVSGNRTWAQGVSVGPYEEAVASYLYTPTVLSLPLATSSNNTYPLASDSYIVQTTKATVDAYTLISSADRLYDRYKSWFVDNLATVWPTFGVQRLNGNGDTLLLGNVALTIDATAGTVFAPTAASNTLAIKATAFAAGTKFATIRSTSGSITLANAASISCGVYLDGAVLVTQDIDAVTGAITTTNTSRIDVASPGIYPAATINAASKIRVTAATSGDIHDCRSVTFSSGSTFENNSGQPVVLKLSPSQTVPSLLATSGTITLDNAASATVTITNLITGSRILIRRTDTLAVLVNTLLASGTIFAYSYTVSGSIPVEVVVRNASGSPAYQEWRTTATLGSIDSSLTANQQPDQ